MICSTKILIFSVTILILCVNILDFLYGKILMIFSMIFSTTHRLSYYKVRVSTGSDRLNSKKEKEKGVFGNSGVLRVARSGSRAKAPPLAARLRTG